MRAGRGTAMDTRPTDCLAELHAGFVHIWFVREDEVRDLVDRVESELRTLTSAWGPRRGLDSL